MGEQHLKAIGTSALIVTKTIPSANGQ